MTENNGTPPEREMHNKNGTDFHIKLPSTVFDEIESHANQHAEKPFKPILLPAEYKHLTGQFDYKSPTADNTLSTIREDLTEHRGKKPTNFNLFDLIRDESTDIKNQKEDFKKKHPEWMRQKQLLNAARTALSLPTHVNEEKITLAFDPSHTNNEYFIGKRDDMENVVISKKDIADYYPDTRTFETALSNNKKAEEAVRDLIVGDFPNFENRKAIKDYLWREKNRWEAKQDHAENEEEINIAQANVDIFNTFIDDLYDKLEPGEEIIQRTAKVIEEAGDKVQEEDKDVLTETEKVIEDAEEKSEQITVLSEAAKIIENAEAKTEEGSILTEADKILDEATEKIEEEKTQNTKRRFFTFKKKKK